MKNPFGKIALVIAVISLIVAIWTQVELYQEYLKSSGKNRALFALEVFKYYKYALVGIIGIIFSFKAWALNELKSIRLLSFSISLVAILLIICASYRLFL